MMISKLRPFTLIALLLSFLFIMTGCPDPDDYYTYSAPYADRLEPEMWHMIGLDGLNITGLYVSKERMIAATGYDEAHPSNGTLFISNDLGFNWIEVMTYFDIATLDVNMADTDFMYIAGTNYINGIAEPKMMISRDYGDTWNSLPHPTGITTEFPLFLKCHPEDYRICYLGTTTPDGTRLYRSGDAGNNWLRVDEFGLEGTICDLTMFSYNTNFVMAGTKESPYVYRSYDMGASWESAPISTNGELQYLGTMEDDDDVIYAGFTHSGIYESHDMGSIWHYMGPDEAGLSGMTNVRGNTYYALTDPYNGVYGQYYSGTSSNWYLIGGLNTLQEKPIIAGFERVLILGDKGFHVYLTE